MPRSLARRSKKSRARVAHSRRVMRELWGEPEREEPQPIEPQPEEFVPSQGRYNIANDRVAQTVNQANRSFVDYYELYLACRIKVVIRLVWVFAKLCFSGFQMMMSEEPDARFSRRSRLNCSQVWIATNWIAGCNSAAHHQPRAVFRTPMPLQNHTEHFFGPVSTGLTNHASLDVQHVNIHVRSVGVKPCLI